MIFLYEYTRPQRVMYTWTRPARNVSMIQLERALKRKYHFDEIFITDCTGTLPSGAIGNKNFVKMTTFRYSKFSNMFACGLQRVDAASTAMM